MDIREIAKANLAFVESDGNGFRRIARVLQSKWRQEMGYDPDPNGRPRAADPILGSSLELGFAEESLANYLTKNIREVVSKVLKESTDQLFARPRIFNNLLSSQPLCFNLFAELRFDLGLAKALLNSLLPGTVGKVMQIEFEYSPGRGDASFTGDGSAFDVFIEYQTPICELAFLGIEVKYHENMKDKASTHKKRYDQIANSMQCFSSNRSALKTSPLQQIWRDHLLAGSMLGESSKYRGGRFIILAPAGNEHCRGAINSYREQLTSCDTFDFWTLEELVSILKIHSAAEWIRLFEDRYLNFEKVYSS